MLLLLWLVSAVIWIVVGLWVMREGRGRGGGGALIVLFDRGCQNCSAGIKRGKGSSL